MHYSTFKGVTTAQQLFAKADKISDCKNLAVMTYNALWVLATDISLVSLAVIALERIYCVFRPFRHRVLGIKSYFKASMAAWAIALTHFSLYFYRNCHQISKNLSTVFFAVAVFIVVCSFLILVIAYSAIYIKLRFFPIFQNNAHSRNEFRLCKVLFYATIASLITYLPETVVQFYMKINCPENPVCLQPYWVYIGEVFLFFNSFINFFIYAWRFPGFRESAKQLIFSLREVSRNRVHDLQTPRD